MRNSSQDFVQLYAMLPEGVFDLPGVVAVFKTLPEVADASYAAVLHRAVGAIAAMIRRSWIVEASGACPVDTTWHKASWVRLPDSFMEVHLLTCPRGFFSADDYAKIHSFTANWAQGVLRKLSDLDWVDRYAPSGSLSNRSFRMGVLSYQVSPKGRERIAKLAGEGITKDTVWRPSNITFDDEEGGAE